MYRLDATSWILVERKMYRGLLTAEIHLWSHAYRASALTTSCSTDPFPVAFWCFIDSMNSHTHSAKLSCVWAELEWSRPLPDSRILPGKRTKHRGHDLPKRQEEPWGGSCCRHSWTSGVPTRVYTTINWGNKRKIKRRYITPYLVQKSRNSCLELQEDRGRRDH